MEYEIMRRRDFINGAVAFSLVGGCRQMTARPQYSVVLLGDTHFDGINPEIYHAGWQPSDASDRLYREREFARNAEMWESRLPRLIASAAAIRSDNAAALIHVGDLIQGDTANPGIQQRMLVDAEQACRKGMEDLPFYLASGNHDIRNGGGVGFDRYLPQSNYLVNIGPDAFVFLDFMRPDVNRTRELLRAADGARHTFIVSHGLCSPHDGWGYYWFLLGKKDETEARRWFRREIASRNAIVIGGHIHRTALMEWQLPEGRITQFVANSVWSKQDQGMGGVVYETPSQFGSYVREHLAPMWEEYDGCHQNRTRLESLNLIEEYKEGLVRYRVIASAGHYQLHVGDSVKIDYYPGDSQRTAMRFSLREGVL